MFHNSKRLETVTAPAGWTEFDRSTPTGDNKLVIFKRVAQSGDTAPTVADTGDHGYAVIMGLRGSNLVEETPVDGQVNTASTTATIPAVTTGGNERLIVMAAADGLDATGARFSGATNANLTSITEQFDNGITSNDGGGLVIVTGDKATAGSTGTGSGTYSSAVVQSWITFAVYNDAGGTEYNETLNSASYTFGGAAIGVHVERHPVLNSASYVFGGAGIVATRAKLVALNSAAYLFGGAAIAAQVIRRAVLNSASYVFGGAAIAASKTRQVVLDSASYVFGGAPISFDIHVPVDYNVELSPGVYTFGGGQINARKFTPANTPAVRVVKVEFVSRVVEVEAQSRVVVVPEENRVVEAIAPTRIQNV